ncbi:unnamed protein product [Boreogadus saida]
MARSHQGYFYKNLSPNQHQGNLVSDWKLIVGCQEMMNPSVQESPKRLAEAVKKEGSKIEGHPGTLEVYKLPLKAHPINVEECMRFIFGTDSNSKRNRTIMVLGATGAGKSTLVNGMINYILGVTWDDTFRFKLVDKGTAKSQAHSQTSEVTVYKLNHREGFQIDYSLTIVDTPGFGDTRGIERDKKTISQLEMLFSAKLGVSDIDAICFVAQASLARLTPTQKYVFDSVLSIFGNDVADNIRILVTFADGQHCQILDAINEAGVPCPKRKNGLPIHFKFNNSALFADNKVPAAKRDANNDDDDDDDDYDDYDDKRFWEMGTNSMKSFFSALNVIETKSLTLTHEVLRQRAQLETCIENLQIKLKLGLDKIDIIRQMKKEHASLEEDVFILMDDSVQCLNTLKEIALKPTPLSTLEYIDQLIEKEKSEALTGFQERITKLQGMRGMWELKEKLAKDRI